MTNGKKSDKNLEKDPDIRRALHHYDLRKSLGVKQRTPLQAAGHVRAGRKLFEF